MFEANAAVSLLFCLLFLGTGGTVHANVCDRRYYRAEVTTQTYDDIWCSWQDKQEIATMMESAMDHELKMMGYKEYQNIICSDAAPSSRRQLLSQNKSQVETPYLNDTAELHRKLAYTFVYQGGGRCSFCGRDNFDHRSLREKSDQGQEKNLPAVRRLANCNPSEYEVAKENFKSGSAHRDWNEEDDINYNWYFGHFLGPLTKGDEAWRRYYIPPACDSVTVMFDFLEFDDWKGRSPGFVVENRYRISPGPFWPNVDEGVREGEAKGGDIMWLMYSTSAPRQVAYGSAKDQSHRFIMTFNRAMRDVRLTFDPAPPGSAKAGFRNVQVLGHDHCLARKGRHAWQISAERRMEIRMMMRSYMHFYETNHCWGGEVPCIHVDLTETSNWNQARPRC